MNGWKRLAVLAVVVSVALALILNGQVPTAVQPVVALGFTDTPVPPTEPPPPPPPPTAEPTKENGGGGGEQATAVPPTQVPPTSTPVLVTAQPAVTPEPPATGGVFGFSVVVWLLVGAVIGGALVWGLSRPGRLVRDR